MIYKAHIREDTGKIQTVKEHSEGTAFLCKEFAIPELKSAAFFMGMIHDIGKYQAVFQQRMDGKQIRVEHSTCGAIVAGERYPNALGEMMKFCIAGHHSGIPDGSTGGESVDDNSLGRRLQRKFEDYSVYKEELKLPEVDAQSFMQFLLLDCGMDVNKLINKFAFLTRYCFSCLTDADSIDTGRFCGTWEEQQLHVDFSRCLTKVDSRLTSFVCETRLQKCRSLIQEQVYSNIQKDADIYLMNMPTGSGKTLCSVKAALKKLIQDGKKRIIYVIPYNSIIDQTVHVFEGLFQEDAEILRHQSSFSYEDKESLDEDYRKAVKTATENYDAPFIITTAVQFFTSVYANKRGKLRKLHNLADSILIFDEAHLMPEDYLQPCLQVISYITKYLNSKAIFLTATMPDFHKLISKYAIENSSIIDLVPDKSLFSEFEKCKYEYLGEQSKEKVLQKTLEYPTCLIVVNKKETAREFYQMARGHKFHLSTYMVACDRENVIEKIKKALLRLEKDYPGLNNVPQERKILVVSTSLVEAGVDLDFSVAFRELTGLDSILQVGGRCNREGKLKDSITYVFSMEEEKGRPIKQERISITKGLLNKYEDIGCPECIHEYYDRLFEMKSEDIQKNVISKRCCNFESIPFAQYAKDFDPIDSRSVSIVVERDESSQSMIQTLQYSKVGNARKLQPYTCTISWWEFETLQGQGVLKDFDTGIWCLMNSDYYDEETGIQFEGNDYFV